MTGLLAAAVGVLLALTLRAWSGRRAARQAFEWIAAEQRTLEKLDPDSYAAAQLRERIEAQVLVMNDDLVLPAERRSSGILVVIYAALVASQVWWLAARNPATEGDILVALSGIGFFTTHLVGALQVLGHRNRIKDLATIQSTHGPEEGTTRAERSGPAV